MKKTQLTQLIEGITRKVIKELDPDTYMSAASQFQDLGHTEKATRLAGFASKDMTDFKINASRLRLNNIASFGKAKKKGADYDFNISFSQRREDGTSSGQGEPGGAHLENDGSHQIFSIWFNDGKKQLVYSSVRDMLNNKRQPFFKDRAEAWKFKKWIEQQVGEFNIPINLLY